MKDILKLQNVIYELPTGDILWEVENLSVHSGDKIGLIGKNGSGKSTLLECILGLKDFSSGGFRLNAQVFYIPQQKNKSLEDLSVGEVLERNKVGVLRFLALVNKEFSFNEDILNKKMNFLSGGEYVKLYIAIAKILEPNFLLLDEPTNHMDTDGILFLINWLKVFDGAFICISHDTNFLDRSVNMIWELEDKTINVYGGNYAHYKEIKEMERDSVLRKIEAKEKEIKKVKKSIQIENERRQRSVKEGNKQKFDRSMEKAAIGYFKEQAEKSASKNSNRLKNVLEKKGNELDELNISNARKIKLKIEGDSEGFTILNIENSNLYLNNEKFVENINIKIGSRDRIRIKGKNGSGKSLLLKGILGLFNNENTIRDGKVYIKDTSKVVYLDQFYHLLDENKTVIDNVLDFNKDVDIEKARKHLANLLFKDNLTVNKKVKFLSGGEKVRLLVTMITITPIDLLILDEPTNNLDIESIEVFSDALKDFKGATIVVSHNESFCTDLNIDTEYVIEHKTFKKVL